MKFFASVPVYLFCCGEAAIPFDFQIQGIHVKGLETTMQASSHENIMGTVLRRANFKKIPNKHKGQTSSKTWCSGNGIHRGQPEGVWTRAPLTPDWTQPCRVYPVCRLLSPSPPMCLLRLLWLFFFCAFSLALFILCPRPTERIRIQLYFGLFLPIFGYRQVPPGGSRCKGMGSANSLSPATLSSPPEGH